MVTLNVYLKVNYDTKKKSFFVLYILSNNINTLFVFIMYYIEGL